MRKVALSVLILAVFAFSTAQAKEEGWIYLFDGKALLEGMVTSPEASKQITDEGLSIGAPSTKHENAYYFVPWMANPDFGAIVEARLKTIRCTGTYGNTIALCDGVHEAYFTFFPDVITLSGWPDQPYCKVPFRTDDQFHAYRIEIKGTDLKLFADGKLVLDGKGQFAQDSIRKPAPNRVGFGSSMGTAAGGEAIWKFVRFKMLGTAKEEKVVIPEAPDLEIGLGKTVTIVPSNASEFFSFFRYKDGRMVVHDNYWSEDGGSTWNKRNQSSPGISAIELPDGTIIEPGWRANYVSPGVYEVDRATWTPDGKLSQEKGKAFIPDGAEVGVDDQNVEHKSAGVFDHGTVQLSDGSLLSVMYGNFQDDKVQIPEYSYKIYKTRVWAMHSTDKGKTWKYLTTVAYDPAIGMESFCEPALLQLPNKDILCFMRTGGGNKHTPLYLSRSTDEGKTWSKPVPIADRGVYPNVVRAKNGILAVIYGRPGNWVAFSADDGNTWQGHFCFGKEPSSFYDFVAAVDKDTFLLIYSRKGRFDAEKGKIVSDVIGTFITVKPKVKTSNCAVSRAFQRFHNFVRSKLHF
ncbi:MAG: sialidase family protein [Kiritimatiellaeota bacterium]|nr:sialidase family protein [Kiritimatiellota bacterium]